VQNYPFLRLASILFYILSVIALTLYVGGVLSVVIEIRQSGNPETGLIIGRAFYGIMLSAFASFAFVILAQLINIQLRTLETIRKLGKVLNKQLEIIQELQKKLNEPPK
jgi:hypothetical protein